MIDSLQDVLVLLIATVSLTNALWFSLWLPSRRWGPWVMFLQAFGLTCVYGRVFFGYAVGIADIQYESFWAGLTHTVVLIAVLSVTWLIIKSKFTK